MSRALKDLDRIKELERFIKQLMLSNIIKNECKRVGSTGLISNIEYSCVINVHSQFKFSFS